MSIKHSPPCTHCVAAGLLPLGGQISHTHQGDPFLFVTVIPWHEELKVSFLKFSRIHMETVPQWSHYIYSI